jgi:hypothetical protein
MPLFANNTLYANANHEIALEQYNEVRIINNIFRDGHFAIHHEETVSHIEGNLFKNYPREVITAGMESRVTVIGNKFEDTPFENLLGVDETATIDASGNDFGDGEVVIEAPRFDYEDIKNFEIDYIPCDPGDKHSYIYDEVDETRRVMKKVGAGLGFGWSLVYADGYVWKLMHNELARIDPETGDYDILYAEGVLNPRGLAWDGEYFWVNDFSLLKIFKLKLEGEQLKVVSFFDIPEKEKGGTSGLTTDSEFLYLRSRDGTKIYKLDKQGNLVREIELPGATLVWTGEYFWTTYSCDKGICKYTKDGKLIGEIYPPAKDTLALAWDGKYIWTIQRTCELWDDPKIYQIEILDDSLSFVS